MNALMKNKRGVIMGVANKNSIAWGIAKNLKEQGAEIILTYQNDMMKKRVQPLAEELGSPTVVECDVSREGGIQETFDVVKKIWDSIDFVVHAIAFSDKDQLKGRCVDTTRDNFQNSMLVSCYSFIETCAKASALMKEGGSLLTLSYYGAEKVMPNYNIMGVAKAALEASVRYAATDLGKDNIRVNAISAGPIRTLAAAGIGDFRYILKWNELNAPLRRNISIDEVGKSATYLLSDLSTGISGEVHHVDCGYHSIGMKAVDAPDIATVMSDASKPTK
jgi:enoyl-[acyl-carrier protein] reductase I